MNVFIDFLVNNYVWFIIICLILVFALIGYLVDSTTNRVSKKDVRPIAPVNQDTIKIHPSVEQYTNEVFDNPLIEEKDAE